MSVVKFRKIEENYIENFYSCLKSVANELIYLEKIDNQYFDALTMELFV